MSEIQQITLSMNGFEVNSYVVHAPEGDIVVDAGAEPEKILGATRAAVAAILVTHGHADHVDGLEAAYGTPSLGLRVGDWLLVCSDGVWGTVDDREIQVTLAEALDPQRAACALIDRVLRTGAPDNATAVVARCVRRPVL